MTSTWDTKVKLRFILSRYATHLCPSTNVTTSCVSYSANCWGSSYTRNDT